MSILSKFRGSSFMSSSRIIPFVRYSFSYPSGVFQELLSCFVDPEASISKYFFVLSFQIRSPIILYPCPFIRLNILLVLRSSILQSVRDAFVILSLNSLKYLCAFLILPGDSFSFISHFRILTMVRSRILFCDYHINSVLLSNPTGGS